MFNWGVPLRFASGQATTGFALPRSITGLKLLFNPATLRAFRILNAGLLMKLFSTGLVSFSSSLHEEKIDKRLKIKSDNLIIFFIS